MMTCHIGDLRVVSPLRLRPIANKASKANSVVLLILAGTDPMG